MTPQEILCYILQSRIMILTCCILQSKYAQKICFIFGIDNQIYIVYNEYIINNTVVQKEDKQHETVQV